MRPSNRTSELLEFIEKSPSMYHVVNNIERMLGEAGYIKLQEEDAWSLQPGACYYVTRNDSSVIAFSVPKNVEQAKFNIVATHSDSPTFKVKDAAELVVENEYVKLNVEKYGGMIMSTWMDRPLSLAGRVAVLVKDGETFHVEAKLVNMDEDLLVIPNVAIHMNRNINDGYSFHAQTDMLPLMTQASGARRLREILAEYAKVEEEAILSHDLFLYVRETGRIIGAEQEYMMSPKLDDLQCAYAAVCAMAEVKDSDQFNICAVFDNEEVGSGTRQGADSTFLEDTLVRIQEAFSFEKSWLIRGIAQGYLISADNAHAVHPNHPEKADPTNRPYMNKGPVIKYHGGQKYTTDAITSAKLKLLCKEANIPVQSFCNHSDISGGSTLGNISTAHVSIPSVDIGFAQLAMHSAVETAGVKDNEYAYELFSQFYKYGVK